MAEQAARATAFNDNSRAVEICAVAREAEMKAMGK
jgi:hypothetical protein